ncbi:MAG: hypothetical protein J0L82_08020 [Deltaproteobacteria bacterium]|nr:hypothetical protein [Deltaproteobacteria bacterium]
MAPTDHGSKKSDKPTHPKGIGISDATTETILDVSAQISHEIVDGAKDRANELFHLPMMVLKFLINPYRFIRTTPDLRTVSWVVLAISSGILGAVVNAVIYQSAWRFLMAVLILPVGAFLSVFATNSILKLVFRGAHGIKYRYRSGASIFAFANLFWWIPIGAAEKLPAVALIGFFAALSIAAVGYTEKLGLPKYLVLRWFAVIAVAHTALWSIGRFISD